MPTPEERAQQRVDRRRGEYQASRAENKLRLMFTDVLLKDDDGRQLFRESSARVRPLVFVAVGGGLAAGVGTGLGAKVLLRRVGVAASGWVTIPLSLFFSLRVAIDAVGPTLAKEHEAIFVAMAVRETPAGRTIRSFRSVPEFAGLPAWAAVDRRAEQIGVTLDFPEFEDVVAEAEEAVAAAADEEEEQQQRFAEPGFSDPTRGRLSSSSAGGRSATGGSSGGMESWSGGGGGGGGGGLGARGREPEPDPEPQSSWNDDGRNDWADPWQQDNGGDSWGQQQEQQQQQQQSGDPWNDAAWHESPWENAASQGRGSTPVKQTTWAELREQSRRGQ